MRASPRTCSPTRNLSPLYGRSTAAYTFWHIGKRSRAGFCAQSADRGAYERRSPARAVCAHRYRSLASRPCAGASSPKARAWANHRWQRLVCALIGRSHRPRARPHTYQARPHTYQARPHALRAHPRAPAVHSQVANLHHRPRARLAPPTTRKSSLQRPPTTKSTGDALPKSSTRTGLPSADDPHFAEPLRPPKQRLDFNTAA